MEEIEMAYSWSVNAGRALWGAGYLGAKWNRGKSSPVLVPRDLLEPDSAEFTINHLRKLAVMEIRVG
jgi:hypothetical protein